MTTAPPPPVFTNLPIHGLGHQGPEGVSTSVSMEAADSNATTLLIRHLPEGIPQETLSRLFSHYGASAVRRCNDSGRLKNCAFVDFRNEALAYQAQCRLNGLRFLGKVLKVERASNPNKESKPQQGYPAFTKDVAPVTPMPKDAPLKSNCGDNLKPGSVPTNEPIAPRVGVDHPFPPHLEYAYPPPDGNILTNIVNALIAVPRFYTQVLHLMNKMNIPAPFQMALPTPPLPPSNPAPPPPPPSTVAKPKQADLSSSESEMESSEEESFGSKVAIPRRKRARKEAIVGPAVDKDVPHEAVGVKPATLIPKEIPVIKKKIPVLQINIAPKSLKTEDKDGTATSDAKEPDTEQSEKKPYLTAEEIERGKLPPEEILSLPMFKNYTAGYPAPVLYIKNLAKDVVVEDFYFIFGSFFGSIDVAKSSLNIRLMQEGRMKGQAFVTFPSVELSHQALNLVNGYVFKNKPIIIQFGRNPGAAKTS